MALRKFKDCIQFLNGNLNLKIRKEDLEDFKKDQILYLTDLLAWFDCSFVGETFCLSNFETGHIIYNSYMDCWYIFPWSELEDLAEGSSIKLCAREMDDASRELLKQEGLQ